MVRINTELMQQRRIQLGWTSEELAERSGLDARTIRRLEQGKTRARLHTAVAVAQALTLDTSAFVLNEGSSAGEWDADEDRWVAAFKVAENTFQAELTCDGDQSFKEVMSVLSLLLTRALATEGQGLAKQEDGGVYEVVAAFKAADVAIRKTLSGGADPDIEQATCVLSLLLTRFGMAFSRRPENGPMMGFTMIEVASEQARRALSGYLLPGHPSLGETAPETTDNPPDDLFQTDLLERLTGIKRRKRLRKDRSEPKVVKLRDKP